MIKITFVEPTDNIIVQEGTFGFSFVASGAISGAMLVQVAGPMQVKKCTTVADNAIGVALDTVAKGDAVTVLGPGNIVRSYTASSVTMGDDLFVGLNSGFDNTPVYGGTTPCVGIALESISADSIRILLK